MQSATILLSDDLGGFHVDMNGLVMEQQDDTTKLRRAQFAQTLSISPVSRIFCPIDFGVKGTASIDSDIVEVHHAVS